MASKMEIEPALTDLEAGKFSFRMVDAINEHIGGLQKELDLARSLHAEAVGDLRRQELAAWRLDGEVRRLNAQTQALLRANRLTEAVFRTASVLARTIRDGAVALRKDAAPAAILLAEKALAEATVAMAKARDYLALAQERATPVAAMLAEKALREAAIAAAKIREYLAIARPHAEKALREMTPVAMRAGAYLEVARRRAATSLEKAMAYLSSRHKTAA